MEEQEQEPSAQINKPGKETKWVGMKRKMRQSTR
jgi:hypothetical protein